LNAHGTVVRARPLQQFNRGTHRGRPEVEEEIDLETPPEKERITRNKKRFGLFF
jgi:hypothetical protein